MYLVCYHIDLAVVFLLFWFSLTFVGTMEFTIAISFATSTQ